MTEDLPGMESDADADADAAANFLEAVLFSSAAEDGFDQATVDLSADLPLVEGYRLIRLLGEGGFGMVYDAEQRVPIRRRVAMKVLRPGMATRELLARFEQERQALALMNHPHIAKIYDAGETEDGRPFITMELVVGRTIDRHAEKISLSDKVTLMRDVSRAVAHAHHKGVIHRDLKPSNILIAESGEGRGEPRVIDFGIAKALDGPLSAQVMFTQIRQVVGTPGYMSPERQHTSQISHIADTRADVFALGAILWELLTGKTPHQRAENGDTRIILPEMKSVPAELRWITEKATDADMERRYADAGGLADDLDNYLTGLPLKAASRSTWYVMRKWAQRHRTATAAVMVMMMTLMASAWILIRNYTRLQVALVQTEESRAASQRTLSHVDYLAGMNVEKEDPLIAMVHWARALRNDPQNAAAAGMLTSSLVHRGYLRPLAAPVRLPAGELRHLAASADGQWAALILRKAGQETLVRIPRDGSRVELHPIPADGWMTLLAVSNAGHVALAGNRGLVGLMGLDGQWAASEKEVAGLRGLAWSSQGTLWCVGFQSVSMVDSAGQEVEDAYEFAQQITSWDATESGDYLALGMEAGNVIILDDFGFPPDVRRGSRPAPVVSVAIADQGERVAAAWPDGRVWVSGGENWSFDTDRVLKMAFLPDPAWLLVREPESVTTWNLNNHECAAVERPGQALRDVVPVGKEKLLFLPTFGESSLRAAGPDKESVKLPGLHGRITAVAAAEASVLVLVEEERQTLEWLTWQAAQEEPSFEALDQGWADLQGREKDMAGIDFKGRVVTRDFRGGTKVLWTAVDGPVRLGALDAAGNTVLLDVPWIEGAVTVEQGQSPVRRPWGVDRPSSLALSPDASLAAFGYPSGEVRLWNLKTDQLLKARDWQRGAISAVAFAGNGQVALAAGSQVILWHWERDERRLAAQELEKGVVALKADVSGERLAVASSTGQTCVLSVRTGLRLSCEWLAVEDTAALGWSQDGGEVYSVGRQGRLCRLKVPGMLQKPLVEVEAYLGLRLDGQGSLVRIRD